MTIILTGYCDFDGLGEARSVFEEGNCILAMLFNLSNHLPSGSMMNHESFLTPIKLCLLEWKIFLLSGASWVLLRRPCKTWLTDSNCGFKQRTTFEGTLSSKLQPQCRHLTYIKYIDVENACLFSSGNSSKRRQLQDRFLDVLGTPWSGRFCRRVSNQETLKFLRQKPYDPWLAFLREHHAEELNETWIRRVDLGEDPQDSDHKYDNKEPNEILSNDMLGLYVWGFGELLTSIFWNGRVCCLRKTHWVSSMIVLRRVLGNVSPLSFPARKQARRARKSRKVQVWLCSYYCNHRCIPS